MCTYFFLYEHYDSFIFSLAPYTQNKVPLWKRVQSRTLSNKIWIRNPFLLCCSVQRTAEEGCLITLFLYLRIIIFLCVCTLCARGLRCGFLHPQEQVCKCKTLFCLFHIYPLYDFFSLFWDTVLGVDVSYTGTHAWEKPYPLFLIFFKRG